MLGFLSQMQRRVWRLAVRGYSLPEMAIALLVLGILLGGIVVPLSSRLKAEARLKTENLVYDAREAVLGYGIANRTVSGVGGVPIQAGTTTACRMRCRRGGRICRVRMLPATGWKTGLQTTPPTPTLLRRCFLTLGFRDSETLTLSISIIFPRRRRARFYHQRI